MSSTILPRRTTHTALLATLGGALLATLVFLGLRAVALDFRGDTQALALLRDMHDLDARRDTDAQRLVNDLSAAAPRSVDRGPLVARALRDLESGHLEGVVAAQLPSLRSGLAEKDAAFAVLRLAHAETVESLRAADDALARLAQDARARDPRGAERTVVPLVERVRFAFQSSEIDTLDETRREIAPRIATLHSAAIAADPYLAEDARRAEAASREFLAARANEAAAWRKFSYLTLGGRIDMAGRSLASAIDNALDDKARWRVYLLAYAGSLLIVVVYLGMRAAATLRRLTRRNAELEVRNSERSSDLAQTLRRLKETEALFVQSEKLASLGRLVAGVAQEIDRPLGFLRTRLSGTRRAIPELRTTCARAEALVSLVQSGVADPQQVRAAVDSLAFTLLEVRGTHSIDDLEALGWDGLTEIDQVMELAASLRMFSRPDRSAVASFNVNDGVQATLLIARPLLRKVDVEKSLGDVPSITCSPTQVNQVILNLVTNAAQAMDKPRGRITVATRAASPGHVAIDVIDNGKGIASEALPRIFERSFEAPPAGEGPRLGLAVAHRIVTRHGGRIEVRSQIGIGSTFTVTLPVLPPTELDAIEAVAGARA